MDENAQGEYVKQVADALKRTGHPRHKEVLDELRTHLEDDPVYVAGTLSFEQLVDRFGSPKEYAENLAPPLYAKRLPWYRRRITYVLAVCGALVLGASLFLPDRHVLAAHYWAVLGNNFVPASPFFSPNRAMDLNPGATEHEVRDAIGIPWRRYPGIGREHESESWKHLHTDAFSYTAEPGETVWEYTLLRDAVYPFYTVCNAVFSADNRLKRVDIFRFNVPLDTRYSLYQPPSFRTTDTVRLSRRDGQKLVIDDSDPRIWLKIGFTSQADDVEKQLDSLRQRVTDAWTDVPLGKIQFIYSDSRLDAMSDSTSNSPNTLPVYDTLNSPLDAFDSEVSLDPDTPFGIVVYKSGTAYEYPPLMRNSSAQFDDAIRADQNWLIHKLLSESR